MSVKEDLIIQADDINIVQGEKAKDYNVLVNSPNGSALSNIPLTIAFYNSDYTFERTATTNDFGVASVPIYLTGDSWFVDVHFKGDENYKPQVVTKEINITKFERLDSYITSENLVINVDEVSMNGTYYTISLMDSYDRPIINEPISITVQQTGVEEPQTYIDVILKTDDDGKIEVPFLSHDENVQITTQYYGCTRFKPCINADIVVFEDVDPRNTVELTLDEIIGGIQYRVNGGSWTELEMEDRVFLFEPIINYEDDNRTTYQGWYYLDSMNTGTYKVTFGCIQQLGDISCYPFFRTFVYENPVDTRGDLNDWIDMQYGASHTGHIESFSSRRQGDLSTLEIYRDYQSISDSSEVIITPIASSLSGSDYNTVKEAELYSFTTVPTFKQTENGIKTYIKIDFYVPILSSFTLWIFSTNSNFCTEMESVNISVFSTSKHNDAETITLSQSEFTEYTYQEIEIIAQNDNAQIHKKVNDYYSLKLLNVNTLEEFYFYQYLVDNVTPSYLNMKLGLGDWESVLISQATDDYYGDILVDTATITTESSVTPPSSTIIAQSENYIDLGTDSPTFADDTISTATTDDDIHSIMGLEFTNSNYYQLKFNEAITGEDGTIIIGADPNLETKDGLFINTNEITLYNDDIEVDKVIFDSPILTETNNIIMVQRNGTTVTVFVNDNQFYKTDLITWNTFGVYQDATGSTMELSTFSLEPYVTTDITPSTADYDGTVFGSNIHLEIDDDKVNLIDYGMLPTGSIGGGKVILNDVQLEKANKYAIQLELKYNNSRYERLNNLTGEIQMRVYEDISTSEDAMLYTKTLCSPMPVPNSKTIFTRHSDEGTLYFVQDPLEVNSTFLTNAYNQYKGGVEITANNISLFSLDNSFSPVYVGNELVRAEFHRRSGFIRLSRYDEESDSWATVNTLKLKNYPQLSLNEYNDDYAEVQFGQTTWKFYRGRPFIICNHKNDDLRILNLVDRVYCETVENQRSMGFIEETDVKNAIFNPQLSVQQFKQELHIGENIRLDNFELYQADLNNNVGEVATDSQMGITQIDNDNALVIVKEDNPLALNFPSYSNYVERVNDTFTLSIDYIDTTLTNIKVKARGFDDRGCVPVYDGIQYGIWEQIQTATVSNGKIKVTFTNCPSEVKYLDFVVIFNGANDTDIILKDFMYYDGDADLNHEEDTSRLFAEQIEVHFADTYYANLYNEKDNCGLCIIRPYQEPFSLSSIYASSETVFAPYMKRATDWDKPKQVFIEYLNAKKQIIDIDWEN